MLIALEPLISTHPPKGDGAAKLVDAPNGSKQYNNLADEFCAHDPFHATWRNQIRERQAKEDALPPKWRQERLVPQWNKLPDCVKEITKEVFASGATDASTLALVRSMLPREFTAEICIRKGRRHCDISALTPIIDRIKHRRKIAELHGQTLAVFENDPIDESTKADDLALLATLRNGETQTAQNVDGDNTKKRRRRAPHIPYKQACAILAKLNSPRNAKTLSRWMNGINTPDGFTPETMATVQSFSEWAKIFAHREQAKINTNNALRIDNPNSRKCSKFR